MEKVQVIPDHLPNKINYKIIIMCILLTVVFHYCIESFSSVEGFDKYSSYIIEIAFIISPLVAGIFTFVIAGLYKLSKVFGRSYLLLGFGYLCSVTAELLFGIQNDIMKVDSYPSIADPFYASLNIFLIVYIIINTRFFSQKMYSNSGMRGYIEIRTLLLFISVFCIIVLSYIFISAIHENFQISFEFFYGLFFVILAGITLPFLLYAVLLFKNSILGKVWHVLLFAFIILIMGDVWYYYLEIFGQYHVFHPVNIFWLSSYWIQIYALYKHKKVT